MTDSEVGEVELFIAVILGTTINRHRTRGILLLYVSSAELLSRRAGRDDRYAVAGAYPGQIYIPSA